MYTYISLVIEICHAMNALHLKVKLEEIVADVGGCYINVSLSELCFFGRKTSMFQVRSFWFYWPIYLCIQNQWEKKMYTKVTL